MALWSGVLLLPGFLLFRVLKIGSDSRFDTIRAHFFKFLGADCPLRIVSSRRALY